LTYGWDTQNLNGSRGITTPFSGRFGVVGWDSLRSTCIPNMKPLYTLTHYNDTKGNEKCKNCDGVVVWR